MALPVPAGRVAEAEEGTKGLRTNVPVELATGRNGARYIQSRLKHEIGYSLSCILKERRP